MGPPISAQPAAIFIGHEPRASCGKVDPVFRAQRCSHQKESIELDPKSGVHFWVRCFRAFRGVALDQVSCSRSGDGMSPSPYPRRPLSFTRVGGAGWPLKDCAAFQMALRMPWAVPVGFLFMFGSLSLCRPPGFGRWRSQIAFSAIGPLVSPLRKTGSPVPVGWPGP